MAERPGAFQQTTIKKGKDDLLSANDRQLRMGICRVTILCAHEERIILQANGCNCRLPIQLPQKH